MGCLGGSSPKRKGPEYPAKTMSCLATDPAHVKRGTIAMASRNDLRSGPSLGRLQTECGSGPPPWPGTSPDPRRPKADLDPFRALGSLKPRCSPSARAKSPIRSQSCGPPRSDGCDPPPGGPCRDRCQRGRSKIRPPHTGPRYPHSEHSAQEGGINSEAFQNRPSAHVRRSPS